MAKKKTARLALALAVGFGMMWGVAREIESVAGDWSVQWSQTGDDVGLGTDTAARDFSPTEKALASAMLNTWSRAIGNTPTRAVDVRFTWVNMASPTTLGYAASLTAGTGVWSGTVAEWNWREGEGVSNGDYGFDVTIAFNTNFNWHIGESAPASGTYDFASVVLHELGHTMGFDSSYQFDSSTGQQSLSPSGITAWDYYLRDDSGDLLYQVDPYGYPSFNPAFDVNSNVTFNGAYATAANGGPVDLFTSTSYLPGSSLVHLGEEFRDPQTLVGDVMLYALADGVTARDLSVVDLAIMRDLGWQIVPEPSFLALLLVGASLLTGRRACPTLSQTEP